MKDQVSERLERFKDCPNCGRKRSMIVGINGWICINCFYLTPCEKEVKEDAETTPPVKL
jgi:ribosomal protein L37AE/L43A